MTGAVLIVGAAGIVSENLPEQYLAANLEAPESFSGLPLACFEILGRSVLARMVEWLEVSQFSPITVIGEEGLANRFQIGGAAIETCLTKPADDVWGLARTKVLEQFCNGAEHVLLARLGAHVELDWARLMRFSHERGRGICRAFDQEGPLDLWLLAREVAEKIESSVPPEWVGMEVQPYRSCSYVNRLRNLRELRKLVVDCLYSRCSLRPIGTEVKPGVWLDDQAHVHREARVVAPAYIGRRSKVQAAALITRSSTLEHDCEVGEATVVEEASILADTYLGRWLDVSNAVVDGNTFVDLRSEVAVEIADGALVGRAGPSESGIRPGDGEHLKFVKRLSGRVKRVFLH